MAHQFTVQFTLHDAVVAQLLAAHPGEKLDTVVGHFVATALDAFLAQHLPPLVQEALAQTPPTLP